ncbi:hypothetical protein PVMG_03631 [Plasmodium vivax Mauritania I]|uniref:Variable surface protein Vir18 n=1 Tax=Plasmodium vivax Mauritania I TaxID=1035515 RepID=A0A0J9T3S7_PLAVI|nr:hypothetical protein PVMG_03631 [Plasmodium vivax Mauritania I]
MARRPGVFNIYSDSFRRYKELGCMTKYNNIQKQILNQIATLNNNNTRNFCERCQSLRLNIINEDDQLKDCYAPDLLRNKLIDDDEIKKFMGKCLPSPNCIYNGASRVNNPPKIKRVPAKACGGINECNKGATSVRVLANQLQPALNPHPPVTNLPVRPKDINIKHSDTEREESTKAKINSGPHNNISITNDPVVVKPGAPLSKGIDPSGTTEHESIPEQPTSTSPNSLPRELGNSSEDSSPQVTPESEYSTTDIAQQKNLETSNHESDQHVHQQVNGDSLDEQNIERPTSQNQDTDERSLNVEEAAVRTLSGENPAIDVIHNLVDSIIHLGGTPSPYNTLTDDAPGGGNYLNGVPLETPIDVPVSDDPTGNNSQIPYKKYTTMALAPTGILMLLTLLSKVNQNVFH